ncbi:MAG: hypothetical protein NC395_00360 [Prevotella sp.]|nr:hypothetical protein [Prevotella sp.]
MNGTTASANGSEYLSARITSATPTTKAGTVKSACEQMGMSVIQKKG